MHGGAVHRARRGEDEAADACLPRGSGQAERSLGVDVQRQRRIETAERVVRERGQVDDRVETSEVGGSDIADVADAPGNPTRLRPEVTAAVEVGVEARDVMPAVGEERREHRSDVAEMTRDEDSHTLANKRYCSGRENQRDYRPGEPFAAMPIDWDTVPPAESLGEELLELMRELFAFPRSLTGDGVRETLGVLARDIPLELVETPSGTPIFDWVAPREWKLRSAWIEGPSGERIVDVADSPLHVLGYSVPVDAVLSLEELRAHVFTHEDPQLVPYRTSYWTEQWGFCMSRAPARVARAGRLSRSGRRGARGRLPDLGRADARGRS